MEDGVLSTPLALALLLILLMPVLMPVLLLPALLLPALLLPILAWLVSMVGVDDVAGLEVPDGPDELDKSACEDLVVDAKVLQGLDEVVVKLAW